MHIAAKSGANLMVYMLAEMGCSVTSEDNEGSTPLHEAILGKQTPTVNFLISLGAPLTAQNNKG